MNRTDTLTTAAELITGDRARDYGDAHTNFQRIADLWFPIVGHVTPAKVALMLAQLKVARLIQSEGHEDSWTDACGYLALGAEIATSEPGGANEDSGAAEAAPVAPERGLRVGVRVRHTPRSGRPSWGDGTVVGQARDDDDMEYWTVKFDGGSLEDMFGWALEVIA